MAETESALVHVRGRSSMIADFRSIIDNTTFTKLFFVLALSVASVDVLANPPYVCGLERGLWAEMGAGNVLRLTRVRHGLHSDDRPICYAKRG